MSRFTGIAAILLQNQCIEMHRKFAFRIHHCLCIGALASTEKSFRQRKEALSFDYILCDRRGFFLLYLCVACERVHGLRGGNSQREKFPTDLKVMSLKHRP